jgi:hypothetical protein
MDIFSKKNMFICNFLTKVCKLLLTRVKHGQTCSTEYMSFFLWVFSNRVTGLKYWQAILKICNEILQDTCTIPQASQASPIE